jgi:Plant transposon protein
MQYPIKCCTNVNELRWSTRLESVRKDVECFFGRLKGRFRILQSNILFHHQSKVDSVFIASSILHNMNLEHDGLDVAWKDPANWETPEDEDDVDIRESRERLRMRGRLVQSDIEISGEDDRRVVVEDLDNVEDVSYSDFRKQLIDHYIYCSDHDLVEWI